MRRLLILLVTLALAGCGIGVSNDISNEPAARPLAIPPIAESTVVDGVRVFNLTAQSGTTDFGDGRISDSIGLNQSYLGPTLRMTDGEQVQVNVTNDLDEMTTLHWHGMHVPAKADGGPHQMIQPGETWQPTWTINQEPATLWYHSHPHGETAQQVYRGLAGMLLIDDPSAAPKLPSTYGVDDVPLIVQDKSFDSDGQMIVDPEGTASTGFLGDTVLVNGTIAPYFEATTSLVRLRLLNASNARVYDFGMADGRPLQMIASDGGYLEQPYETNRIQLSPAERAEVVVRLVPGETVKLMSYPPDLGSQVDARNPFGGGTFGIVELRAAQNLADETSVPAAFAPIAELGPATVTRPFRISGRAINGRPMQMGRIDEVVEVGAVEIWELTNADPQPHNFHVHDVQFQVLDIDGQPPPPELAGRKDTVYVPPRSTVRIKLQFTDYTDPTWPYMFHCHLLWHEDIGIMGQFVVINPGEQVVPPTVSNTNALGQNRGLASAATLSRLLEDSICL